MRIQTDRAYYTFAGRVLKAATETSKFADT
jgi:hypothetical protein